MGALKENITPLEISRQESTRCRLMDAAEFLMAESGADAVSVRAINKAAGTSVGVMHYHFRDKNDLIEAVVLRHMEGLQDARLARYTELLAAESTSVEEVIEALVSPFAAMAVSDDPAHRRYVCFMDRVYAARNPILEKLVLGRFRKVNQMLFVLLKRALPALSEPVLTVRTHQASLTLTSVLAEIAMQGASPRAWQEAVLAPDQHVQALIDFIVGGLVATNNVDQASDSSPKGIQHD